MWGRRPRLDGESQGAITDGSEETEHERVKSVADGGFLVREIGKGGSRGSGGGGWLSVAAGLCCCCKV